MAYRLVVIREYQSRDTGRIVEEHLVLRYHRFYIVQIDAKVDEEIREVVTTVGIKWAKGTYAGGNIVDLPDDIGIRLKKLIGEYRDSVRELNKANALGPFSTEKNTLLEAADKKVRDVIERLERV